MYSGRSIAAIVFLLAAMGISQAADKDTDKPGQSDPSAQTRQTRAKDNKSITKPAPRSSDKEKNKVPSQAPETSSPPLDQTGHGLGCAAD